MIEHVCVGDEAISFHTFDLNAEYSAGHHHANLTVLLQAELAVVGHLVADHVVVLLNITNFF